jgi:hypothetical protein
MLRERSFRVAEGIAHVRQSSGRPETRGRKVGEAKVGVAGAGQLRVCFWWVSIGSRLASGLPAIRRQEGQPPVPTHLRAEL